MEEPSLHPTSGCGHFPGSTWCWWLVVCSLTWCIFEGLGWFCRVRAELIELQSSAQRRRRQEIQDRVRRSTSPSRFDICERSVQPSFLSEALPQEDKERHHHTALLPLQGCKLTAFHPWPIRTTRRCKASHCSP